MLPVPIETLRVRVGLDSADASRDDDINSASATALALMANYCDRYFDQVVDDVEIFTHRVGWTVPLKRYPIVSITSLLDSDGKAVTDYHIAAQRGILNLDSHSAFHLLTVTYTGGYAEGEFPPDLLSAFYSIFDQEWAKIETSTSSAAPISSVSVQDVGTVRFRDDTRYFHDSGVAFMPVSAAAILDAYKRFQC